MNLRICALAAALLMAVGCGSVNPSSDTEETPAIPDGTVPIAMVGTWYSDYSLVRVTIAQNSPAQYEYTYDGANEFRGGIDVDETGGTIHYAETYYGDGTGWAYDEDPYHVRARYLLVGDALYTDAFDVAMTVWKRTAGASGELVGTWEYQMKRWYGAEDSPSYLADHKRVLTLNADGTYTRKIYLNDEVVDSTAGNYTYGDINPDELYLSATADIGTAWVVENDYLVMGPRYYTLEEIALLKQ